MALNYADLKYLYGIYNDKNDDEKYDFLIQIITDNRNKYVIDVLTGNYFKVRNDKSLTKQEVFNKLINPIYDITIDTSSFPLSLYPNPKSTTPEERYNDTILFNYFKERCSPLPILPVILEQERYFIKDIDEDEDEVTNYYENEHFHPNAFEEDDEAPATLTHKVCDIDVVNVGSCTFIDPILKTPCPNSVFRTITYIEKSKEDYDKIINRLKPIPVPDYGGGKGTSRQLQRGGAVPPALNMFIESELADIFDVNNKPVTKVFDVIQENFGKHISLDGPFQPTIDNPSAANVPRLQAEMEAVKASDRPPVPLLDQMSDNIGGNETFRVFSFLRSYIDLYHDIETYATDYRDLYYNEFIKTISPAAKAFLDQQILLINESIFTRTGNVSQERCKVQIERIANLFIRYLHGQDIATNPTEKESARIMSASIDNIGELTSLIATLIADGVVGFFVESANNNIGEILVKKGVPLYNLTIGDWDAGSGYSGGKLKPIITQIGPAGAGGTDIVPNMPTDIFGIFRVEVSPDNNTLDVSDGRGTSVINVKPRQKLSVNKLLIAAGRSAIRGTEDTKPKKLEFTHPGATWRNAIIALKPWTDLIQIKTMSGRKILTIISDTLCETTSRMYGLYDVLLCQGKIVTYYSYNINSRNLTDEQIKKRVLLRYFINILEYTNWIKKYLNLWFTKRINTLTQIIRESYDPILFFISKAFIERYTIARTKSLKLVDIVLTVDIKSIPDTLDKYIESVSSSATLLADLLELYLNFKTAIKGIEEVGARGDKEIFLNTYKQTQRLIVNTFGKGDTSDDPITLRAMVACTFAYYFIKNPRYTTFLTKLDDLKLAMIRELYKNTITRPQVNAEYKVNRINTYYQTQLNASLPKIKSLPEIEIKDEENVLRSIVDIQIAIQTLLTEPPAVSAAVGSKRSRNNNSNNNSNNSGEDANNSPAKAMAAAIAEAEANNSGTAAAPVIAVNNSGAAAMAAALEVANNSGVAAVAAANNLGVAVANNSPATAAAAAPRPKKQKRRPWPPRPRTKKKKAQLAVVAMNNSGVAAAANNSPVAAMARRRRTVRQRPAPPPAAVFNYRNYIINVLDGKVPNNPYYSFEKVIEHITKKLNYKIDSETYFGGTSGLGTFLKKGIADPSGLGNKRQKKLSKTHKKRLSKRKTYKKRK